MNNRCEYNTRALSLVLDCLKANEGTPLSAEEITEKLLSRGEQIGKTTVYRNLEKLLKKELIGSYKNDNTTRYCFCGERDEHIHIICQGCGKLSHLECSHIRELEGHIASSHGFTLDRGKTVLYGLCGECAK